MNEVVCIIWLRFTPSVFDLSILWFAAGYIALDVCASSLTGVVMASVLDRSTGAILAVVLDHTAGAILGFVRRGGAPQAAGGSIAKTGTSSPCWKDEKASRRRRPGRRSRASVLVSAEYRQEARREAETKGEEAQARRRLRSKMPERSRCGRMRLHLELGEVEAALAVYHKSSRSWRAGSRPRPTGST